MSAPQAFPQSEPNDSDSVADTLDAGLLHWVKGEKVEALRCLRQARTAADDAGDDQRALALARAAADLTPEGPTVPPVSPASSTPSVAAPAASLGAGIESQSAEARRSKRPEPPAPPKKFTGATDSAPAPAATAQTSRASVSPTPSRVNSIQPEPAGTTTQSSAAPKSTAGSGAASSLRPSPPSARPSAISDPTPASSADSHPTTRAPVAANSGANPAAATVNDSKVEPSKVEVTPAKKDVSAAVVSRSAGTNETRSKSTTQHSAQLTAQHETRASSRPEPSDHRLASLRVKLERVEADGQLRIKLLDLAATASGEDNAILIVPQALWQELKRGG